MQPGDDRTVAPRTRVIAATMRAVAHVAQAMGRGGSVAGGHVGLRLDADLIEKLASHRRIVAVSATNGKTTTTSLLTSALRTRGPVLTNAKGSNLRTGLAAALALDLGVVDAALEVDEATLASIADELRPAVIVLGNLSRDQLDRYGEVRIIAERWRQMFARLGASGTVPKVVANADDPLVVWSVQEVRGVVWVGAGAAWTADAEVCPSCTQPIMHDHEGWHCEGCSLTRPSPEVSITENRVTFHGERVDREIALSLAIPGAFNIANAALALTAADLLGIDLAEGARAMSATDDVAGRYRTIEIDQRRMRLLMAKNPAGWQSALDIVRPAPTPIVVAINARVADGHDPSWLFDVPFSSLAGRTVVAAGERAHDLSVRLHYAGVDHTTVAADALAACRSLPPGDIDLVANYTAFADVLAAIR